MERGEWDRLSSGLRAAGVDPSGFGAFVNRVVPGVIEPSTFDEARAAPVLLDWLPRIRDPTLREAMVMHLKTKAAKGVAVPAVLDAFRHAENEAIRWQAGDTLQYIVTREQYAEIVPLAADPRYGTGRQMLVDMLWRIKTPDSERVLIASLTDPDVALHAGSALRRLIGNEAAIAHLEPLVKHPHEQVAYAARRNLQRARKALRRAAP